MRLRSRAQFAGPGREAIHRLKYKGDQPVAEALGGELAAFWRKLGWPPALVVPVPLSRQRQRERGYNQSELLACMFAGKARLPLASAALARQRHTEAQVGLNAQERHANVQAAFGAQPALVAGKTVLLIDDVCTTGATLEACAQALRTAGAAQVYGLTVGRAVFDSQPARPHPPGSHPLP